MHDQHVFSTIDAYTIDESTVTGTIPGRRIRGNIGRWTSSRS